eukprot:11834531-Karenia_brevis.AAC.1
MPGDLTVNDYRRLRTNAHLGLEPRYIIEPYMHPRDHSHMGQRHDPRPCLYDATRAIGELPTESKLRRLTYLLADMGPHMVKRSQCVMLIEPTAIPE